jgi:ATP-dependent Clp protease ATP-binding subunit ClpA
VRGRLGERGVDFQVLEAAKSEVVREGYDPNFGARPLRRVIERRIENPLAKRVLSGEFASGDCIVVDFVDGEYTFTRQAGAAEAEPVEAEGVEV